MTRKLRLAWVSTYNARCGIAEYSQHLLENFDADLFDITVLADAQEPIAPDPDNVVRVWRNHDENLVGLTSHLLRNHYDIAFFQHNFGFFDFDAFANLLVTLDGAGIATYVTLHRTMDDPGDAKGIKSVGRITAALRTCSRLFVHSVEDMNRLKQFGLSDNVTLVPHGVLERPALDPLAVRQLLGLQAFEPVIGTFGFLVPGKGLPTLIHAFALLLQDHPGAFLLMLNSEYPDSKSRAEHERCLSLIRQLGLEGRVRLIADFLEIDEIYLMLGACDAIVYSYEWSTDSDSGAVRLGLAAGRPVATTPVPVFASLSEIVYQLSGTGAVDIAEGIIALLADNEIKSEILKRQREWVHANGWPRQAARIAGIMRGCFEEKHRAELRPSAAPPPDAAVAARAAGAIEPGAWPAQALDTAGALLHRRPPPSALANAAADSGVTDGAERAPPAPAAVPPDDGRDAWPPRIGRKRRKSRTQVLADRARDARQWPKATGLYRKMLDEEPDAAPIWVQYGHALKETGRFGDAEDAYRQAIALRPTVADTHLQLGHVLKLQDRPVEAAAAYLRALALDPGFEFAMAELLAFGWNEGRVERSLRRERDRIAGLLEEAGSRELHPVP